MVMPSANNTTRSRRMLGGLGNGASVGHAVAGWPMNEKRVALHLQWRSATQPVTVLMAAATSPFG